MQRTRLSTIVELAGDRLNQLFINPWRRIALLLISFLFGVFMGSLVITTAGQNAVWDVYAAAIIMFLAEIVSYFFYSRIRRVPIEETVSRLQTSPTPTERRSLFLDILNLFKVGLTYSLFLEAFKLGS
jgi:Na+/melibiose symporter-like transporter